MTRILPGDGPRRADGLCWWLLAGALPAKDTTCQGLPLPVPAAAGAAAAAAGAAAGYSNASYPLIATCTTQLGIGQAIDNLYSLRFRDGLVQWLS